MLGVRKGARWRRHSWTKQKKTEWCYFFPYQIDTYRFSAVITKCWGSYFRRSAMQIDQRRKEWSETSVRVLFSTTRWRGEMAYKHAGYFITAHQYILHFSSSYALVALQWIGIFLLRLLIFRLIHGGDLQLKLHCALFLPSVCSKHSSGATVLSKWYDFSLDIHTQENQKKNICRNIFYICLLSVKICPNSAHTKIKIEQNETKRWKNNYRQQHDIVGIWNKQRDPPCVL